VQEAKHVRHGGVCAASTPDGPSSDTAKGALNESDLAAVLAQLRKKEAEAQALRDALEAQQKSAAPTAGKSQDELAKLKPAPLATGKRIDGATARLGGVSAAGTDDDSSPTSAWLSERDLDFFVGAGRGVGEQETGTGVAAEDQGTVSVRVLCPVPWPPSLCASHSRTTCARLVRHSQRRLAIGAVLTAGFAAWSLVPDDSLSPTPAKPLFFYIVALLRARQLLTSCEAATADADWQQLKAIRQQVLGASSGDTLRENLTSAAQLLPDAQKRERARQLVTSTLEYVDQTDYNAYFDNVGQPSGAQNAEFAAFCLKAVSAAERDLDAFIALMPAEDLEAARSQIAASSAWVLGG